MNNIPEPNQISVTSPDGREARLAELRRLFPDLFDGEGVLDEKAIREIVAEEAGSLRERFQFGWAGKSQSRRFAFAPSGATLSFDPERSFNADGQPNKAGTAISHNDSKNLIIEGDNLEVLKLLQSNYFEKVKCIYIDPPYNTGKDFIYPDDFSESRASYWNKNGTTQDGVRLVALSESDGRRHSQWLSMMQPRLLLARQLLSDEGAIFISIDDNEYHNLKRLCDEIFGTENHLATLQVKVRYEGKTLVEDMDFQKLTEQVLIYSKSSSVKLNKKSEDYSFEKFCFKIVEHGEPRVIDLGGKKVEVFEPEQYEIVKGEASDAGLKEIWATGKILDGNSSGRFFRDHLTGRAAEDGLGALYKVYGVGQERSGYRYFTGPKKLSATKGKYFQSVPEKVLAGEVTSKEKPITTFYDFADSFGNCRHEGATDFRDGKKPTRFINTLLDIIEIDEHDVVLDFFAGSGSLAHAVMLSNANNGSQKSFILVQVPEFTDEDSDYRNAGFSKISDLTIERVRRSGAKVAEDHEGASLDLGFRTMKLVASHFPQNTFSPDPEASEADNIKALEDHLAASAQLRLFDEDEFNGVITEIALKNGFGLFYALEHLKEFSSNTVNRLSGNGKDAILCLDGQLDGKTIEALKVHSDEQLIVLKAALDTTKKFELQTAFKDNLWVV